jgi:predicted ribosome quality control (RQC) complex YloA/Tae2 family protein
LLEGLTIGARRFEVGSGELSIIVREISAELPRRVTQVYRGKDASYILRLRSETDVRDLKILPGKVLYLATGMYMQHDEPDELVRRLRENLRGAILRSAEWIIGERITHFNIELRGRRLKLVVELYPAGGIHLIDENQLVVASTNLRVGEKYEVREFRATVSSAEHAMSVLRQLDGKTKIGVALARDLHLGTKYSDEVLARSGIPADKRLQELGEEELKNVASSIESIFLMFERPRPMIYRSPESEVVHAPFPLLSLEAKGFRGEEATSLNEAIMLAYENHLAQQIRLNWMLKREEQIKKIMGEIEERKTLMSRLEKEAEEKRASASLLYMRLGELKEMWNTSQNSASLPDYVKAVDRESGIVTLLLNGREVRLSLKEPVGRQVERLFQEAKKIAEGVRNLAQELRKLEDELNKIKSAPLEQIIVERPVKKTLSGEWFKRYRWSMTSSGRLIVSGRDSASNIRLLKRHLEPRDLVFHAEVKGSPVTVLKGGADAGPDELYQAATVCACYSRAWREGHSASTVYWVTPKQISFSPPTGTYLPKGSFIVQPPKNYITVELAIAIGYSRRHGLLAGEKRWVASESEVYMLLKPGRMDAKELFDAFIRAVSSATDVDTRLITFTEFQALIPYGRGQIIEGPRIIGGLG